jgi:hypothetical protein
MEEALYQTDTVTYATTPEIYISRDISIQFRGRVSHLFYSVNSSNVKKN